MHRLQALFSALLVALFASSALASVISTFSDDTCKDSFQVFNGPDGFPNGTCVQLKSHGAFGSFQVTQLDDGCGVTIYHKDATAGSPCSDPAPILANLGQCYNSSWVYFSIDNCVQPDTTTSSSGATATASTAAASSSSGNSTNVGAIVGGVVGGVCGLGLIALAAWFLWLRDGRSRSQTPLSLRGSSLDLYPTGKKGGDDPADIAETGTATSTTTTAAAATSDVATSNTTAQRVHELEPTPNRAELPTTGTWTKYEISSTEVGQKEVKFYSELPGHGQ
ncbi:hypothetical protein PISL3812_02531 [Talaromyces islandicus]|uniref:Uncharacterized protein n=1 Tax=Talaromyces islandicus TaxID=28573 RepID=A0A0U1LQX9_TALIS|nr:hypothetical protein PISL3812_02531 [Talaromyces islandicus]